MYTHGGKKHSQYLSQGNEKHYVDVPVSLHKTENFAFMLEQQ